MINLVDDWRRILAVSISFWMQLLGLLVLVAPEVRIAMTGVDSDPVLLWWLGILLLVVGVVGRLFAQGVSWWREWLRIIGVTLVVSLLAFVLASQAISFSSTKLTESAQVTAVTTESRTLDVAVPFIAKWEGKRNKAYQDIVGVWTVCYGHTRTARPGMHLSDAECLALLRAEVAEYRHGLHEYFNTETKSGRLTPERDTAYTSLAFNVGIRGAGRSTATRRINAGDVAAGCKALTWWNKAGGRVIRGLVNRRNDELTLCMVGL